MKVAVLLAIIVTNEKDLCNSMEEHTAIVKPWLPKLLEGFVGRLIARTRILALPI